MEVFAFPLSFAQERLWFLDQLEPGTATYNVPAAFRLAGPIDADVLERSVNEIVRRHEVLRTTFRAIDGVPTQIITPALHVPLVIEDFRDAPLETAEAALQQRLDTEAGRPFDLMRGPLVRMLLLQLGNEDHVLMLVMHHIISEGGWSLSLFQRELSAIYAATAAGQSHGLPELPIQYADYVVWQREAMGDTLARDLEYWKQHLSGAPPLLELPTDRPRPPMQSSRGAKESFVLPGALAEGVRALSHAEGVTPFMTLMAAWLTLLRRYSGQTDIVIGTAIAGRARPEVEALIGFFASTLALRIDLSGDPPFRTLLQRVRKVALGAFAHQDVPFEKLVEELRPERSLSHPPLFQVLFSMQNVPQDALALPAVSVTPLEADSGTAMFDLTLFVWERPSDLRAVLEYSTALFDRSTIRRMLQNFQMLLESALATPGLPISRLPLLAEEERHKLLVEWNDTAAAVPPARCVHTAFEASVARTPDAVAVTCNGSSLTYRELDRRANQLAHHLLGLGVRAEVLVGICLEPSLDMVVGVLGILKAGGAYVPLDPTNPAERLSFMLEDAGVTAVVTRRDLAEHLPPHRARTVCLDSAESIIAQESDERPLCTAQPFHLAYVMYTSGSTGRPKGVEVCHASVVHLFDATRPVFNFAEHDVWTVVHSYGFDISVWETFGALLSGGRLVVVPREVTQRPLELFELIRREHVTIVFQTPSALRQLIEATAAAGQFEARRRDLHLRLVMCGGEAFPPELVAPLLEWDVPVWNFYGPTEATVWAAIYPVNRNESPVPIGRPFANIRFHVLDAHLQPLPIGVAGDLYIGGRALARGYHRRPALTADRFVVAPFAAEGGARLYKTGDWARYRADGNLEFLGRVDHQVKVRGFRIELNEIDAVLAEQPSVSAAVVVAREQNAGDKRLVAYVVPAAGTVLNQGELRASLQRRLPEYMVPAVFVSLDALPLNTNRKIDRARLPAPELSLADERATADAAPRDALEQQLVAIWERVLGVRGISALDNFFDLGGHSLLAVRLYAEIQKIAGRPLPLALLFQAPTLRQFADALRQQVWSESWSPLVALQRTGKKAPLFLVHAIGGNVLNYRDLAFHLRDERPVYALQAVGLDGRQAPNTRVEEIAARYIREIRAVHPHGLLHLGGSSFGGVIAFEMARQLREQGERLGPVILLEAYPSARDCADFVAPGLRTSLRSLRHRVEFHARNLWTLPARDKMRYFASKAHIAGARLHDTIAGNADDANGNFATALRQVKRANKHAFAAYRPRVYPGSVTLFRTADSAPVAQSDPTLGWSRYVTGGVTVFEVPGDHRNMIMEPHVRTLVSQLQNCFNLAEATAGNGKTTLLAGARHANGN